MSYGEFALRALATFCLLTILARFGLSASWGSAIVLGVIVAVVGTLGTSARRQRRREVAERQG